MDLFIARVSYPQLDPLKKKVDSEFGRCDQQTHIVREATDCLSLLIGALVGAAPLAAVGRRMIAA